MATRSTSTSMSVMEGFSNLPILRQIGLMIGLSASIAVGFGVVLWAQEPDYRAIYSGLTHLDANQVTSILQAEDIKYKIDTDQGILLVDAEKIHTVRMKLAAAGIPLGETAGYELLDKSSGIGTSQFMEKARYQRSIEGELAKTIASLSAVKAARVHLAIPKRSLFIGDRSKPSASVLINLFPGAAIEKIQVASIVHLVASSISDLDEKNVTVVDQKGRLLSEVDSDNDVTLASKQYEHVRQLEKKYIESVNNILAPILGEDAFKVEVTAAVDFTKIAEKSESFNPDLPAIRSEQVIEEKRNANAVGQGIPGALANQPPAVGTAPEVAGEEAAANNNNASLNSRKQSARNYELDKTVSYTQHQIGMLKRLNVAVVVDHLPATNVVADNIDAKSKKSKRDKKSKASESALQKQPISREKLEELTQLVKEAVGYNPARGDRVLVINQAFIAPTVETELELPEPNFMESELFKNIIRQALGAVFLIALAFGVLRPILKSLAESGTSVMQLERETEPKLSGLDETASEEESMSEQEILLPGPGESYEAQLNAVKNMVADDPRRVAQVVKTWLANE